jgi:hypothetical protein
MAIELGPLEKQIIRDCFVERGSINEVVLGPVLGVATGSRRPTPTQPQLGIGVHHSPRERTFPDSAGADENHQQWFSGQGLERVLRVASDQDRECVASLRLTHSSLFARPSPRQSPAAH